MSQGWGSTPKPTASSVATEERRRALANFSIGERVVVSGALTGEVVSKDDVTGMLKIRMDATKFIQEHAPSHVAKDDSSV